MKVGISEWSLHQNFGRFVDNPSPLGPMEFLELASEWGIDGVQIERFPEDQESVASLRAKAEALGLFVQVEACGLDPAYLEAKLEVAGRLGAKLVRTFPALNRYERQPPLGQRIRRAAEALGRVAEAAEGLGILVAVENHQSLVTDRIKSQDISCAELLELLDMVKSPYVGACLDTGNCLAFLEDPVEAATLLAPRTLSVHLKDYRIKRTLRGAEIAGCALGEGAVDLPAIVRLVAEKSPLGDDVCLSVESPVERIQVPFLDAEFWDAYDKRDAARIPRFLRFIRDRGGPADADLRGPAETGKSIEEILQHEKEQNRASIEYARRIA